MNGTRKLIRETGEGSKSGLEVVFTRAIGAETSLTAKVGRFISMEIFTLAIGLKAKLKDMGSAKIMMEHFIKGNGMMIQDMVLEIKLGRTGIFT